MASSPGPAMEFLGRVAFEMQNIKPLLPTYVHLLISAIFPIYTAAHATLARPSSAAPLKKNTSVDISELQDEEISPTIEALTPSDAIIFPVLAGATLTSLYFILKWLEDPELLNYYMGLYFAVAGLYFTVNFAKDALATVRSITFPNQYSYKGKIWKLKSGNRHFSAVDGLESTPARTSPLPAIFSNLFQRRNSIIWSFRTLLYTKFKLKISVRKLISITTFVDTLDFVSLVIALPLVWYHTFVGKPWFLTNFLGFSFCYGSLQITTPGTSWTGTLLLFALFLYDIYFVFFTPMMVTVATKLDVPIKLLFPRPSEHQAMAMLGLGDIVIPGMMLAFALRFDLYLYYQNLGITARAISNEEKSDMVDKVPYLPATGSWGDRLWTSTKLYSPELQAKRFPKRYFNASVVGYILGMIVTVIVMQVTQHGQPALLYLVPGVLSSLWGVALIRGDFKALWNYSEIPDQEKTDNTKEKKNGTNRDSDDKDFKTKIDDQSTGKPEQTSHVGEGNKNNTLEPADQPSTQKTSDSSDEDIDNHILLFSLSLVQPNKAQRKPEEAQPEPEPQPQPPKENEPPKTPTRTPKDDTKSDSDSSDDFSISSISSDSEGDNSPRVPNHTTEPEPVQASDAISATSKIQKAKVKVNESKGDSNSTSTQKDGGEPAVKRRRKA